MSGGERSLTEPFRVDGRQQRQQFFSGDLGQTTVAHHDGYGPER